MANDSGDADGGSYSPGRVDAATRAKLDELLDLAADRYIEEDPLIKLCHDKLEAYQYMLDNGLYMSNTAVDAAGLRSYYLSRSEAVEYSNGTIVIDAHPTATYPSLTWYVHGGEVWRARRSEFEYLVPLFERLESYQPTGFEAPIWRVGTLVNDLTPTQDFASNVTGVLATTSADATSVDAVTRALSGVGYEWSEISGINEELSAWTGDSAKAFRGGCLLQIPSVLAGQTIVAHFLHESLKIVRNSFMGLRLQTLSALNDGIDTLTMYPVATSPPPTDWAKVLNVISGIAATITFDTAIVPGGITVAGAAAIVSGGAALMATIIGSPAHPEALHAPPAIEGGTVKEIMGNFHTRITRFLDVVDNCEQTLARVLGQVQALANAKGEKTRSVLQTDGHDYPIYAHDAFFEIRHPDIADIADEPGNALENDHLMGPAPREGAPFATNIKQLLKNGKLRLPELASRFYGLAGAGADDGVDAAFRRTSFGYIPGQSHDYATTVQGALYPAWTSLYQKLTELIQDSGEALQASGDALVAIGKAFAETDAVAAAHLGSIDDYLKGLS